MFFAPTLINLASIGSNLYLLSITSGNSENLGPTRMNELLNAAQIYGIPKNRVYFLDPEERKYPDGFHEWNVLDLSLALLPEINRIKPKGIVTFDKNGISGHPNHKDCFRSLKMIRKNLTNSHLFALESVPIWRKYSSFFDLIYLMIFGGENLEISHSPIRFNAFAQNLF